MDMRRWSSCICLAVAIGCSTSPAPVSGSSETSTTAASETDASETDSETGTGTGTGEQPACPATSAAELMDCVEQDRYLADLEFVAEIRTPGSPHWQAVQDLCFDRLAELGYAVELHDYGTGINVLGVRPGTELPDERVIVGAHYDHIPDCSGADDNGSGIAATLELARVLADLPTPRTLVIACWDEEELGLIGSDAHAQAALDAGEALAGVFSLDSIGYASNEPNSQVVPDGFNLLFPEQYGELESNEFRGDFLLWVSDDTMKPTGEALDGFAAQAGLPTLGTTLDDVLKNADILSDLRRSDHASFWARDLPAMFFNDTGEFRYPGYHCGDGDDTLDRVDLEFAVKVARVAVATAGVALGL